MCWHVVAAWLEAAAAGIATCSLRCGHCGELAVDTGWGATHPHQERSCALCNRQFVSPVAVVANPLGNDFARGQTGLVELPNHQCATTRPLSKKRQWTAGLEELFTR